MPATARPTLLLGYQHIGVDSESPRISPARGSPLWDDCDAHVGERVAAEPDWAADWDEAAQPAPDYEVDQRILAVARPGSA